MAENSLRESNVMNRRIGFLFAVIPVLLVILAVVRGGWYYIANWPALSFAIVGSGYWHFGPGVFGKRADGTLPIWRIVILAPYLFYSWGMWHLLQLVKRENPFDQLLPDVLIGRRLLASEFPDNVERVLDLTAEFPVPAGIRNRVLYHSFKILDASVPPAEDVVECLDQLDREHGVLYIHCAEGHGRTGLLAAALLLRRGEAASTEEAVNKVKAVRPRVRLNAVQRQCLEAVARQLRNRTTNQQSPTDED